MTINELYSAYQYISNQLEDTDYLIFESGALKLFDNIINGKSGRKDALIFAINDMLKYAEENNIILKSSLLIRFKGLYW